MTRILAALAAGLALAPVTWAPVAGAEDGITLSASINGADVARSDDDDDPVLLDPAIPATVRVTVTNTSDATLRLRTVRVEGRVLGLTFFAYDTRIGLVVEPGATESLLFDLDLAGLGGQATGLVRGSVAVLDADRTKVASTPLTVDVRGSMTSVYGLFGSGVALVTVPSSATALAALARGRLPAHRWSRATRFLTPGLGVGLTTVFTLSAVRVWAPTAGRTILLVAVPAVAGLALGYLTPAPADDDEDLDGTTDATGADSSHDNGASSPPEVS